MAIIFPADATGTKDKLEYLYATQEALRLEHNDNGQKFLKDGLSKAEWDMYQSSFMVKSKTIGSQIAHIRDLLGYSQLVRESQEADMALVEKEIFKTSKRWMVDVGKI